MAYNRKNLLKDILWVQEVYKEKQALGINNRRILKDYINIPGRKPISERTLYYYLEVSPKVELRKIEENEKRQLSIFPPNN
jgi:hypothetical protein